MTAEGLSNLVGATADAMVERTDVVPPETSWELYAEGSQFDDLSTLIESVLGRLRLAGDGLLEASIGADALVLRITQYVAETDPVGPGFAIESEDMQLLSVLGVSLDVDQYVI